VQSAENLIGQLGGLGPFVAFKCCVAEDSKTRGFAPRLWPGVPCLKQMLRAVRLPYLRVQLSSRWHQHQSSTLLQREDWLRWPV